MDRASVIIIGNVGKEPEAQFTPQADLVTKFSVAVSRTKNGAKETDWYNCVAWKKTAELIGNMVTKGTRVLIDGRQAIKSWTDKEGVKHTQVEITVTSFDVLAKGKAREEASESEEDMPF